MTSTNHAIPRRSVAITAALAVGLVALLAGFVLAVGPGPSAAAAGAGGGTCPNAEQSADDATVVELRRSVRCLVNVERAIRGRSKLERDKPLQSASQKHAAVMVATGCLAHRCGEEADLETRIQRSGYVAGAEAWQYAESTGCGVSAEAMVANWMASKFHRINILEQSYGDIGVGVVQEPVKGRCDDGYATFAVVFGWRDPDA